MANKMKISLNLFKKKIKKNNLKEKEINLIFPDSELKKNEDYKLKGTKKK